VKVSPPDYVATLAAIHFNDRKTSIYAGSTRSSTASSPKWCWGS